MFLDEPLLALDPVGLTVDKRPVHVPEHRGQFRHARESASTIRLRRSISGQPNVSFDANRISGSVSEDGDLVFADDRAALGIVDAQTFAGSEAQDAEFAFGLVVMDSK